MKCSNCNEKIKKNTNFCPNCGIEIKIDDSLSNSKKSFTLLNIFKAIGKGIWFVISSIGYIIGTIFAFEFICDLFGGKKDKK